MGSGQRVPGADFSNTGLGKYQSQAQQQAELFITASGITLQKHKDAVQALYNSLFSTGQYSKFSFIRLTNFGSSIADSIDVMNPSTTAPSRATFINDLESAHTLAGFVGDNAANRYIRQNVGFPAGVVPNFHMHVYNSQPGTVTTSHQLGGAGGGTAGQVGGWRFLIGRAYFSSARTGAFVSDGTTNVNIIPATYDNTKTGLLSVSFQGGAAHKLYDAGSMIASVTQAITVTGGGTGLIGKFSGGTTTISSAAVAVQAGGFTEWTDADEFQFNTIITQFIANMA